MKTVKHWSRVNNCYMTFAIFLPEDRVEKQRREPYPAIYFCSGLTCTHENATTKMMYASACKKRGVAMIMPDTSPRGVDEHCPEAGSADWTIGYGAGHYCNATQEPWNKHFNMYSYITEELPSIVERYFHISKERRSIMGFSMGGNGALICAAKQPERYVSVTALAPISRPTTSAFFCGNALPAYFGSNEAAKDYSISDILNERGTALKLPPGYVDVGARDQFMEHLQIPELIKALNTNGHRNFPVNYHEDYNHSFYFINEVIEDHIDFHAAHLNR